MKTKSLLKDLSKFYGIPYDEANAATMTVEHDVRKATTKHGDDKNLFVLVYDDAMKYSKSFRDFIEKYPEVGQSMKVLFKQNRSLGRHAGGVLVCDDLKKKMPLIISGGEPQSPWVEGVSAKHLEKIGTFIKFDILGLETLRLIERTITLIIDEDGIIEFELEGNKYRLRKSQKIKLSNEEYIEVRNLTKDHDIKLPCLS